MPVSENAAKLAAKIESAYGVPPSVTLAQYILESASGSSKLATEYNNYFGITGSYNGNSVKMGNHNFRVYSSIDESFDDYGRLMSSELYRSKTKNTNTIEDYIDAFAETYAPTSDGNNGYAATLKKLIEQNNLTQYDGPRTKIRFGEGGSFVNTGTNWNSEDTFSGGETLQDKFSKIVNYSIKAVFILAICILAVFFFKIAFDNTNE